MSKWDKEYVILDVDDFDGPDKWMAVCFLRVRYPSRQILDVREFYVDRTRDTITHHEKRLFWQNHSAALQYNLEQGAGIQEAVAEKNLCQYVSELRAEIPHFFLVSDNPGYDVAVVDKILTKHGYPPLSQRSDGRYAQTLCAWSYRLALTHVFREKAASLFQCSSVRHMLGTTSQPLLPTASKLPDNVAAAASTILEPSEFPPLTRGNPTVPEDISNGEESKHADKTTMFRCVELPHTVVYDCRATMNMLFQCFDLASALHKPVQQMKSERSTGKVPASTSPMRQDPQGCYGAQGLQRHQAPQGFHGPQNYAPQPWAFPSRYPAYCYVPTSSPSYNYHQRSYYQPLCAVPLYTSQIHALRDTPLPTEDNLE